ncbi:MAG: restriction endonuclease [Haloarculaceae archaeon]
MGQVIKIDNPEGDLPGVLTETGSGGLLSTGYLRDRPVVDHLESETPVFALTNKKRGVTVRRDGADEQFTPGSGYRTVAVFTDRRLVTVVGDGGEDGDRVLAVPFDEIEGVSTEGGTRNGRLVVTGTGERIVEIHCGGNGLDDAGKYLKAASQAWIGVERRIDDVRRSLVTAAERRDEGEYERALEATSEAETRLTEARSLADELAAEWRAAALGERVDEVERRYLETLAEIRAGRAREFTDQGERHWREGAFERAHDAFDRARREYEAVRALESVPDREAVVERHERVEKRIEDLRQSPLRTAVEADRKASEADDPETAAQAWAEAMDAYRTALELDWGADERRFAGDPEQIRERLGTIAERMTGSRRAVAAQAKEAGEWYFGADQPEIALEEFETAREWYESAIAVAEDVYPDAVDHLQAERSALERRIEQAEAAAAGETPPATDPGVDHEPDYEVEATIGTDEAEDDALAEAVAAAEAGDDGSGGDEEGDGEAPEDAPASIEDRLRALDESTFREVVTRVLSETGWTPRETPGEPFALEATKDDPAAERVLVRIEHRPGDEPVGQDAVEACSAVDRAGDADAVMLATSGSITPEGTRHARRRQVRLLDDECLSAVIESRDLDVVPTPQVELEE